MIAELITHQPRGRAIVALGPRLYLRDALPVIGHVQRFALQGEGARVVVLHIHFEAVQVEPLLALDASRRLGNLAGPLAGPVVHVVRALALVQRAIGIVGIHRLALRHGQLVMEIPLHRLQLRHRRHVAVKVVPVPLGQALGSGDKRGGQAIADLSRFQRTGFVVEISTRPSRMDRLAALMDQLEEVAGGVIVVVFGVCPHGFAVMGARQANARRVAV
ncbi:hypothetical protein D3C85_1244930 [compost metagenome]